MTAQAPYEAETGTIVWFDQKSGCGFIKPTVAARFVRVGNGAARQD
jgi:cold shock CspA family protein